MKKFLEQASIRKLFSQKNVMLCFSPPVMIITFVIELLLAITLLVRNPKSTFSRVAAFTLILLGSFQISEYIICTTSDASMLWARIGMAAISLLPPTGIYLISLIKGGSRFLKLSFILGIGFFLYFLLVPGSQVSPICGDNYVILNVANWFYWVYAVYYIGFLLLGIGEAWVKIKQLKGESRTKQMLKWSIAAYTAFMLPTAIIYFLYPISQHAIASIMCGFALIMAFILTFKIVPLYNDTAHKKD